MLREMKCVQRMVRVIPISLDGSVVAGGTATTTGILEGKRHVTVTENSAGNYTFVFNEPFQRTPVISLTPLTDVSTCWLVAVSTTGFQVEQVGADQTTPLADADFHALVVGFDTADQY